MRILKHGDLKETKNVKNKPAPCAPCKDIGCVCDDCSDGG